MAKLKQKLIASKIFENGRISVSKAMKEVGYSDAYSTHPDKLTKTKSWIELMEKYLPDEKIVRKIDEGLEANRVISAVNTGKEASGATSDFIEVPDFAIRHKYVETSLKIKGKLDNKGEDSPSLIFNFYGNRLRSSNPTPTQTESST